MRLSVRHLTRYNYAPPALRSALRLKLFPPRFEGQTPGAWRVSVNGADVAPLLVNGLGEAEAIWTSFDPQASIEIIAEGVVDTHDCAGVVAGLKDQFRPDVFLRDTPLTAPNDAIRQLAAGSRDETLLSSLHRLCHAVRDAVDYTPRATTSNTPAAQALELGHGVCQDHAHIFIAGARAMGAPARYVTGYLTSDIDSANQTHAWAEAYAADLGWVGFDPANRQCPTDAYIRLCAGFDAADAAPARGCVSGGAGEDLRVEVEVAQAQQ